MSEKLGYDVPRMTRDEATEICVYHLRMAAALFQLVPDDANASLLTEMTRTMESPELEPAIVWAACILEVYDAMKEEEDK